MLIMATIGIVVGYLMKQKQSIEGFISDVSDNEYEDDPRDLPWIASWTQADRFARQGHNCSIKHIQKGRDNVSIITTSKSCEGGMPHTRTGDRILIPDSIPDPLRAEIIAHEYIHIYQTRNPTDWSDFYHRSWSFELFSASPTGMPTSIIGAKRSNPDTFTVPWSCWMGRYWPVAVYTDPQNPTLRNSKTIWWDQWKNAILTEPPQSWTDFFGNPSQNEHPHEIAAVLIVSNDTSVEAGRRLNNWWALHEHKQRKPNDKT